MKDKALVVLSGGQDSTTCLYWALREFGKGNVHAITFDYGQRHRIELQSAAVIAEMAGLKASEWELVIVPDCLVSASPLTSNNELDKYESFEQMEAAVGNKVEKTFVPLRNTFFLTIAANRAVAKGCNHIVTGICQADNANYPDCTEDFRSSIECTFNESLGNYDSGSRDWLYICTPLMFRTKAESIELAMQLDGCMDALAFSHTSYDGKYPPTDNNHANVLRADGFEKAGVPDPLVVRAWMEGLMELPNTKNYDDLRASSNLIK